MFGGDVVEHRRHHVARAAPLRPEVDEHRRVALQHLLGEGFVGNDLDNHMSNSTIITSNEQA